MDAAAFRHLYDYHFTINRKIWDEHIAPLAQEDFVRKVDYSIGSVRNQVVHMMNIDDRWFSGLRGLELPGFLNPVHFTNRDKIRRQWDAVEQTMRDYLANLSDAMLFDKPFATVEEDNPFRLWQVLLHVANHGTDHRAQLLRLLYDLGVETGPQDYIVYVMGRL